MDVLNLFLQEFQQFQDVTFFRLVLAFFLAASLSWIVSLLYMKTYRGSGYSQSMSHTLILISCIVAIVMIVIGSNIARAFSLVGALSIIRFRTAVKNTRDTAYIFLTMAIGMAAGSRFYFTAVVATLLFCVLILILHNRDIGGNRRPAQILRIHIPLDLSPDRVLADILATSCSHWEPVSIETVRLGSLTEATYQVHLKNGVDQAEFLNQIRALNENQKVVLFQPDREISL